MWLREVYSGSANRGGGAPAGGTPSEGPRHPPCVDVKREVSHGDEVVKGDAMPARLLGRGHCEVVAYIRTVLGDSSKRSLVDGPRKSKTTSQGHDGGEEMGSTCGDSC